MHLALDFRLLPWFLPNPHSFAVDMSELDHLRKKLPDDEGLLLDTKDRRLKRECQECGVKFYIVPAETHRNRHLNGKL